MRLSMGMTIGAHRSTVDVSGIRLSSVAMTSFYVPTLGMPSEAQHYSVRCAGLSSSVTVSAPGGYQVSASPSSGYANSIILDKEYNGTIYVRMTGVTDGQYNGYITHASTGVDTVSVFVSGSVGSVPIQFSADDWLAYDSADIAIFQ